MDTVTLVTLYLCLSLGLWLLSQCPVVFSLQILYGYVRFIPKDVSVLNNCRWYCACNAGFQLFTAAV